MLRRVFACLAGAWFFFVGFHATAQNSFQTLQQELDEARQQHDEETSKALAIFFTEIDAAMASPDAALALYKKAKGPLPPPLPVVSEHDVETASEREDRENLDQANLARLGAALQLHCGMMHFAALFIVKPDEKGLQEKWAAWLQTAAQAYPQLAPPPDSSDAPADDGKKKRAGDGGRQSLQRPPPVYPEEFKARPLRDSIFTRYLAFKSWKDHGEGGWAVKDIPQLYRDNVLEPLRKKPTADTLAAWDIYIGLANADEKDNNRWLDVVYPPLQFDRACDAYQIEPSTEKLEVLVNLIKANPTYPNVDDWISRVSKIMDDYGQGHGIAKTHAKSVSTTGTPATATGDPNVTVTTEKQGDTTIVTTRTNSASATKPTTPRGVAPVMNMESVMDAAPVINPGGTNAAPSR